MPRGDGTGPTGEGAMTGRGAGSCTGFTPGVCSFLGLPQNSATGVGLVADLIHWDLVLTLFKLKMEKNI